MGRLERRADDLKGARDLWWLEAKLSPCLREGRRGPRREGKARQGKGKDDNDDEKERERERERERGENA